MVTLITLGALAITLFPAPQYSKEEKRNLAAFPEMNATALFDGSVCSTLEAYATERMPARTLLRRLWGATQLAMGLGEAHGVILCRDGSLCRRSQTNEQMLAQNVNGLEGLQDSLGDIPLTTAIVPRRIDARAEILPSLYKGTDEKNICKALPDTALFFGEITQDAQWFRTDHHWTQEGAYHAYCALGSALGYVALPRSHFIRQTVWDRFFGSSAAAAGIPYLRPDTLTVWRSENEPSFRVLRDGASAEFFGLYDFSKLDTGDEYAVFLGGNCGVLEIDLGEEDERPVLLVLRDSFASALLPFLAQHYRILAVDPRYAPAPQKHFARADLALCLFGFQTIAATPVFSFLSRMPKT